MFIYPKRISKKYATTHYLPKAVRSYNVYNTKFNCTNWDRIFFLESTPEFGLKEKTFLVGEKMDCNYKVWGFDGMLNKM